jgi:hypothetical protein
VRPDWRRSPARAMPSRRPPARQTAPGSPRARSSAARSSDRPRSSSRSGRARRPTCLPADRSSRGCARLTGAWARSRSRDPARDALRRTFAAPRRRSREARARARYPAASSRSRRRQPAPSRSRGRADEPRTATGRRRSASRPSQRAVRDRRARGRYRRSPGGSARAAAATPCPFAPAPLHVRNSARRRSRCPSGCALRRRGAAASRPPACGAARCRRLRAPGPRVPSGDILRSARDADPDRPEPAR